jgi:putative transposase
MKRTNTFKIKPKPSQKQVLEELLDASASLWNEINYQRRQAFFNNENIWNVNTGKIKGNYKKILGSSTAQQINRKNTSAWKSFLTLNEKENKNPSPPGYWKNENKRQKRTYIRKDCYNINWSPNKSHIEIPIGQKLKEKHNYGYREKLKLEIRGKPKWKGEKGRLEINYDEIDQTFRAYQPVKPNKSQQDSPLAEHSAALDIGANNIVACTTSKGKQYLYKGRKLFQKFHQTTRKIAQHQSKLPENKNTSKKIKRLYKKRTRRRNHAQNTLARNLVEKLHKQGISTIYIGKLKGVLEKHWKPKVNEKTHNFWAFQRFIQRLKNVAEEYGIKVKEKSEAWTTSKCPECGNKDTTTRHKDTITCTCGYEGHADLKASRIFLEREEDLEVRLMAQPVRFEWDDHNWSETSYSCPKEQRTNLKNPRQALG